MTDTHPTRTTTTRGLSRRAVTRGALWAAPTLVVTSAAPAMAASLRKDPGINGWVRASWGSELVGWWPNRYRRYTLTVNSTVSGVQTPDGAPFGLYLYDTDPADVYTDATFTYWINDTQASIQWTAQSGHSSLWSGPVSGPSETKPDGHSYTPYTWTYNGTIDPSNPDGNGRVWLGHFNVQAVIRQQNSNSSADLTFWAERSITQVRDGVENELTFQRRAGKRGTYTAPGISSAGTASKSAATEPALSQSTDAPTQEAAEETVTPEIRVIL